MAWGEKLLHMHAPMHSSALYGAALSVSKLCQIESSHVNELADIVLLSMQGICHARISIHR